MSLCYNCLAVFFLLQLFNKPNIATNKTIQHKLMRLKENNKFFPYYLILTTLSYMVGVDKVVRVISKAHYLLYIAKVGERDTDHQLGENIIYQLFITFSN